MIGLANKKDFLLVSIVGLLFGVFLIPILENIRPPHWELNLLSAAMLIAGFCVFSNIALMIGGLIGKKFPPFWQFTKFGAGGALNAAIDIGLLNLLSLIFQIFSGPLIILFNAISLAIAMTNSYLWNKLWTFKKNDASVFQWAEYFKFSGVTLGSVIFGSAVVYFLTTVIGAPQNISPEVWENIAKLASVPPIVAWNFIAYKFFVFKS